MRTGLMDWLSDVVDRIGMRLSKNIIIDGIWIGVVFENDISLLDRAREAISFIETYDPVTYTHLQRNIDRIWITLEPHGIGKYIHRRRLIVLDARYVREADTEVIASLVVHEATHARLIQFGYDESIRARIERCCIRREVAFARRYSWGEPVVRWALERHDQSDNVWLDDQRAQRWRAGESAVARELGIIPGWLVHVAHRARS
ncbi:hypothetical protein G3T14_05405 [Methylobacterium sp. BTF04]|uniref:hypothetical protein n=1 Tax=Methylobacterium sp. BTF04 TaxID=2708300 RepID=UPI0013D3CC6E|nr:hypothetical protein [Methylobacterium sp. BTF04]NEU11563.1 hypothetical protein [Methylobacterium sp. BTF04]